MINDHCTLRAPSIPIYDTSSHTMLLKYHSGLHLFLIRPSVYYGSMQTLVRAAGLCDGCRGWASPGLVAMTIGQSREGI